MKRTYLNIILLTFIIIFTTCQGYAYEINENENENPNFIGEQTINFINSPLNNNFESRFKDLFITKDTSQFKCLTSISIQYNTMLLNPQELYYTSPAYSAAKNCLQLGGASF